MVLHANIVHLPMDLADANRVAVDVPAILSLVDQLDVQVTSLWNATLLFCLVGIGGDVARRPI